MSKTNTPQSGHAILELAIVLPLLVLLAAGGLEFSRYLEAAEVSRTLSRELTGVAYRECASPHESVASPWYDPQLCLQTVVSHLLARTGAIAPHAEFLVSLYNYDDDGAVSRDGYYGQRNYRTRFSVERMNAADTDLGDMMRAYGTVVVGEVFLPYRPIYNIAPWMGEAGTTYASTIM